MTKKEISWATIDELVTVIAKKIHTDSPNIDSIYGIPRGGLIPAVLLSHKLGLPLVQKPRSNSLVVDDISDSGNTFIDFIDTLYKPHVYFPDVKTASLFERQNTAFKPDYVGLHIEYQDWLVFPWEYEIHAIENSSTIV